MLIRSNSHLSSKRLCICPPSCNHPNYQSLTLYWQLPIGFQALARHSSSKKKLILTKKTYLTTDPSQTCHSYPSSLSELSLLDLTTTSPQTPFSIRTNLASLNTIPQKLSLCLYITNWSLS